MNLCGKIHSLAAFMFVVVVYVCVFYFKKYLCIVILFNFVAGMGMIIFIVKRIAHP